MSNKIKVPTIIGVVILAIGLATGVLLVQNSQIFRLGASGGTPPKDVRITNISDSAFTVTWVTEKETSGFVLWGETDANLSRTENDEVGQDSYTHSVTIRGLSAQATYYFKINSGGEEYDNNKIPWQTTLGPSLSQPSTSYVISGTVLTATGTAASGALVYVSIGGVSPLSTTTSNEGSWVVTLSQAREVNLNQLYSISNSNVIEISVQAGALGTSSAQIYPASAKPVPPMILGQVHDYKNLPASTDEELPVSSIEASGEIATQESKFNLSDTDTSTASTSKVTLESVEENETITSTKPQFFGSGPEGTEITILVESENPISSTTEVNSSGDWSWTPPQGLAPGEHKITLSWRDVNGILQTITKTFIVQAAEGPAYEASSSASLTPTPKVSSTPKATSSATPKATSTAKTATSSAAPKTPDSGTFTPTIIMFVMGLILFTFGGGIFYSAIKES